MTAAEIHEPLKVRQVKGSSAAVCEINSDRKKVRIKPIDNFNFSTMLFMIRMVFVSQKPMRSARTN